MIIPRFKLTQTENEVTINIRAPYCRLQEVETEVTDGNSFLFLGSPYYLRLNLPGNISEEPKSSYDVDHGEFNFTYEKLTPGEHFEDLELINKLLNTKKQAEEPKKPTIEVLSGTNCDQSTKETDPSEFGFALQGKKDFFHVSAEFQEVFEIDPRTVKLPDRRTLRRQNEQASFSLDHYICDYIEDDQIVEIMKLKSPWANLKPDDVSFTDEELDYLKDLPNKEFLLSEKQVDVALYSLVDILFAYCYDRRTTDFEGNCESGWTIVKLASTFSWLDAFHSPKDVIVTCFRRALIYPLYRHFNLLQTVFADLKLLLKSGEKYIVKVLIDIQSIFVSGDCCRYILNNLFIRDYIVFVQKWDKEKWRKVVDLVSGIVVEKNDLDLRVIDIDHDECEPEENLAAEFGQLTVVDEPDSDDCSSSSDSSSCDSDSSSCDSDSSSCDSDSSSCDSDSSSCDSDSDYSDDSSSSSSLSSNSEASVKVK